MSDLSVSSEAGSMYVPPGLTGEVRGSLGRECPLTPAFAGVGGGVTVSGVLGLLSQIPTAQTAEVR